MILIIHRANLDPVISQDNSRSRNVNATGLKCAGKAKKIRKNVYSKTTELEKTIAMVFIMNLLCIYMNV